MHPIRMQIGRAPVSTQWAVGAGRRGGIRRRPTAEAPLNDGQRRRRRQQTADRGRLSAVCCLLSAPSAGHLRRALRAPIARRELMSFPIGTYAHAVSPDTAELAGVKLFERVRIRSIVRILIIWLVHPRRLFCSIVQIMP